MVNGSGSSDDEASAEQQLRGELDVAVSRAPLRPILHHLSADSAWLIQLPRPGAGQARRASTGRGGRRGGSTSRSGSRLYYNILLDPWLSGSQVDLHAWFSKQWHAETPRVGSIHAVEELARRVEEQDDGDGEGAEEDAGTAIDVVVVCHEFTDHCHQKTLVEVSRDVPVFATEKAAARIRSWNHFRHVETIPSFTAHTSGSDWCATSVPPLPEWLGIARLVSSGHADPVALHSGLVFIFPSPTGDGSATRDRPNAIVYTPHGIFASSRDVHALAAGYDTLALLHGVDAVHLGLSQLNLGADNGAEMQKILGARYWMATHDEDKRAAGVVRWLLRREKRRDTRGLKGWVDVANGENVVLR